MHALETRQAPPDSVTDNKLVLRVPIVHVTNARWVGGHGLKRRKAGSSRLSTRDLLGLATGEKDEYASEHSLRGHPVVRLLLRNVRWMEESGLLFCGLLYFLFLTLDDRAWHKQARLFLKCLSEKGRMNHRINAGVGRANRRHNLPSCRFLDQKIRVALPPHPTSNK